MSTAGLLRNKFTYALLAGMILTLASLAITNINLATHDSIPISDPINQYFDTCVGNAFTQTTPKIRRDDHGFPLSYYTISHVPVCDNFVEIKTVEVRKFDPAAMLTNLLIWSTISYFVLHKFKIRRHSNKPDNMAPPHA